MKKVTNFGYSRRVSLLSELLSLLSLFVAQDTSNPPGDEYKVGKLVEKFFVENNIRYKVYCKDKKRPNVVGFIGKGKPKLLVAAHMDVVPAGKGWKSNAFRLRTTGSKVYGRGVVDNKGPLACMLIAAKELKAIEDNLKGSVMIAAVSDEERGSVYGMKMLMRCLKPSAAIIPDVAENMKKIIIAEKGAIFLRVEFFGKSAHGSRPALGKNAILMCNKFIDKLLKYKFKQKKHEILGEMSINIGKIKGGCSVNSVAANCEIEVDIRYVPGMHQTDIVSHVKEIAKKCGRSKVKLMVSHKPHVVDEKSKIVSSIKNGCKKAIRKRPKIAGISGATVAKMLVERNIPAVGFGCGNSNVIHAANESIKIKELEDFAAVLRESIISFLK